MRLEREISLALNRNTRSSHTIFEFSRPPVQRSSLIRDTPLLGTFSTTEGMSNVSPRGVSCFL